MKEFGQKKYRTGAVWQNEIVILGPGSNSTRKKVRMFLKGKLTETELTHSALNKIAVYREEEESKNVA